MPDTWPQKLVGSWTLVSWEQKKADGSKVRRYGENPVGIAFLDAGGRYIISVMRSDRANTRAPLRGARYCRGKQGARAPGLLVTYKLDRSHVRLAGKSKAMVSAE